MRRRSHQRRGAAAIEFAFWMVAFLWILVGVIDLSYFLNVYIVVQRAARDAARHGSTVLEDPPVTGTDIEDAAYDHAELVLDNAGLTSSARTIVAEWTVEGDRAWIDVQIAYPVTSLTGLFPMPIDEVDAAFSMLTQEQGG